METIKEKKRETITIYLEKEEKEYLVKKAKASGITANAYIRNELFREKRPNMQMQGTVQVDELLDGSVERNRSVTTYLSEEEYQYVKKNAGGLSVASFVRKLLLAPNSKYTFDVKTDDLDDIRKSLSDFNLRMDGIIGALRYRSELYGSDIMNMKRLMDEVNESVKKSLVTVMTDRKYVKKKGVQHLQNQINKLLEKTENQYNN